MAEYFERESLIKTICEIGDDSKGGWSTSSIVDFLLNQPVVNAEWYGRELVVIDRFYPSSQICSVCGAQWSGTKDLSVREWTCPKCGTVHNRDVNAVKNILAEGLRILV